MKQSKLLFLSLMSWAIQASANVSEDVTYEYYEVRHVQGQALAEQMRAATPIPQGFYGHTKWHIRWNVRWRNQPEGCTLTEVAVVLTGKIILPRLHTNDPVTQRHFATAHQALKDHEWAHFENGRRAAYRLNDALRALPSQRTCGELESIAQQTATSLIEAGKAADKNYDARTGHGRTEGAVFN